MNNWEKRNIKKMVTRNDGYYDAFVKNAIQQYKSNDAYYETKATDEDLTLIYQNALARKIVNAPAEDVVKNGFEIDGDEDDKIYQELETLMFERKLVDAIRWDRLFGRSCILMLIDDGKALNEPVDERNIRKIHGLEVYDKRDISENYSQAFINSDPTDENFGQLEYYIITPPAGNSFIVHHSRLLLFDGEELPRRERVANNGAGLSCLDGVIKAIRRVETAHARAMDGVERSSTSMLKLNGLMDMVQSEQGTSIVQQRLDLIDLARQMLHTIAIDKEDEYQIYNMSLGGIAPLINEFEQIICGMTTIPMTILFGRSPGGMNATGYADFENYNNMVRRIQKVKVKPVMERLVKYIMLSKEGPFKGKELENWSIKFNDLQQQTDLEKEQLEKTKIDRHMAELNMINTLIQSQMLDPNDAKTYLIEQQELPITEGEIDLDDFNAQQNEENIEMDKQVKGQASQPAETKNPLKPKDDTLDENTVEQKQDNVRTDNTIEPNSKLAQEQVNAIRKYTTDHTATTVADHKLIEKAIKTIPLDVENDDYIFIKRGVALTKDDIKELVESNKFKPNRLTSWTTSEDVALDYAKSNVGWSVKSLVPVMLVYEGNDMLSHAIDVTEYALKPSDKEIIMSSNITMYVKGYTKHTNELFDDVDYIEITLGDKATKNDNDSVFFAHDLESKKKPKKHLEKLNETESNEDETYEKE